MWSRHSCPRRALAALIAIGAGERLGAGAAAALAVIVAGVFLAAVTRGPAGRGSGRAALYALGAATAFGASLYATGRVGEELPIAWAVVPPRVAGVLAVALPLALAARLRLTRRAFPLVAAAGVCEVVGFASFVWGARDGIAVASVLASQFAALAAIGAAVLFRERLTPVRVAGVAFIAAGVATLSALQV